MIIKEFDYISFSDKLYELYGKSSEKRNAAFCYVSDRLTDKVKKTLEEMGIDEECRNAFISNDKEAETKVINIVESNREELKLSQLGLNAFKNECKADKKVALDNLKDLLLEKEFLTLQKKKTKDGKSDDSQDNKLYPKTWGRFRNGSNYTTQETAEKLAESLSLLPHEKDEFFSLILKDKFEITNELSEKVFLLRKNTGKKIVDFCEYACISGSCWANFYNSKETDKPNIIEQKTLLKLVLAFNIDEENAKAFMALPGSGFYKFLDNIFLACICLNLRDPVDTAEIIDFYINKNTTIDETLSNPYNE